MKEKFTNQKAFTLIELLIVIAIIGLLSSIILTSVATARRSSREAFRRASLRQVQTALELYYYDHNGYPSTGGGWWGEPPWYGSHCYNDGCTPNGPYIAGLAPTYISKLPTDPMKGSTYNCGESGQSGFLYNSNGTDYKLLAHCVVEVAPATTDPFYDPVRPTWALQVSTTGAANW